MKYSTDDRVVKQTMRTHPKQHAKMAQRMINKLKQGADKPGVTTEERKKIERKMRGLNNIKKKFESGKGLSTERYE